MVQGCRPTVTRREAQQQLLNVQKEEEKKSPTEPVVPSTLLQKDPQISKVLLKRSVRCPLRYPKHPHPSIKPYIHPAIHPSIHPSVHPPQVCQVGVGATEPPVHHLNFLEAVGTWAGNRWQNGTDMTVSGHKGEEGEKDGERARDE